MKKKSTIVALPVVPFNQAKLSDVCQYLDYLQNFLSSLPLPEVLILHKLIKKYMNVKRFLLDLGNNNVYMYYLHISNHQSLHDGDRL